MSLKPRTSIIQGLAAVTLASLIEEASPTPPNLERVIEDEREHSRRAESALIEQRKAAAAARAEQARKEQAAYDERAAVYRAERLARKAANHAKRQPKKKVQA